MSSVIKQNQFFVWEERNLTEPKMKLENKETFVPNDITGSIRKNVTKNEWRNTGKVSGIYKIINKSNDKYYVGSSNNVSRRWWKHRTQLNSNQHANKHLQSSWNKYGKNNFNFVIVESVSKEKLITTEQKYLDIAKNEQYKCYNQTFLSSSTLGFKYSEESKRRLSISHKGQIPSVYCLQKVKLANSGKNNYGYNHTIFHWYNDNTKKSFKGTCDDFRKKYKVHHVYCLVYKKRKSSSGWRIVWNNA